MHVRVYTLLCCIVKWLLISVSGLLAESTCSKCLFTGHLHCHAVYFMVSSQKAFSVHAEHTCVYYYDCVGVLQLVTTIAQLHML